LSASVILLPMFVPVYPGCRLSVIVHLDIAQA
jgi:hypothetical protein